MGIQNWSEEITVVDLGDDPRFSEDLESLMDEYQSHSTDVVLNFASVGFINSSDVAKLLKLRKLVLSHHRRLVVCDTNSQIESVFQVTGLDKVFESTQDIATALASIQMSTK